MHYRYIANPGITPLSGIFCIASITLHAALLLLALPQFIYLADDANLRAQNVHIKNSLPVQMKILKGESTSPSSFAASKHSVKKESNVTASNRSLSIEKKLQPDHSDFYYSGSELTKKPELRGELPNNYLLIPDNATTGYVRLLLNIDSHGVVNSVKVLGSSLDRYTEGQIVFKFYKASYQPGEIDGKPVASQLEILIQTQGL
jgi:hypothetical protein